MDILRDGLPCTMVTQLASMHVGLLYTKLDQCIWYCIFQVSDLEKKLSSAYNQIEQLSHALSDRGAQLDIERNSNMVRKFCCFSVLL